MMKFRFLLIMEGAKILLRLVLKLFKPFITYRGIYMNKKRINRTKCFSQLLKKVKYWRIFRLSGN